MAGKPACVFPVQPCGEKSAGQGLGVDAGKFGCFKASALMLPLLSFANDADASNSPSTKSWNMR
jgi:hypothetical protein